MTWKQLLQKLKDPRNVIAGLLVFFGALQAYSEAIVELLGPALSGVVLAAVGVIVKLLPWLERLATQPTDDAQ